MARARAAKIIQRSYRTYLLRKRIKEKALEYRAINRKIKVKKEISAVKLIEKNV